MSLPLRITFENKDYTYSVLTRNIDKDTKEIKISLQGEELTLIQRSTKEWDCPEQTVGDNHGLIKAIGKNIALRYRL
ncbi:hypothetical protein [Pedobacter kyonggii]|uniref:Uncharacterized protein n=1 Tax=Pedobacter kyonggii TaxID=1926871 RepID=A0A4V2JGN2_9SPHI|nr:hypothetical protein [Pedobacter kyonggii]TBO41199.1 hypothetical protein EYS08_15685 [Pedobacter kyonggii]